jgi:GTP-binding protein
MSPENSGTGVLDDAYAEEADDRSRMSFLEHLDELRRRLLYCFYVLGDTFLGHVERCAVLLHLVDVTSETVVEDYRVILGELVAYGAGLAGKPRVLALNKIDALPPEEVEAAAAALGTASGLPVLRLSGATGAGVPEVLRALRAAIDAARGAAMAKASEPWRP